MGNLYRREGGATLIVVATAAEKKIAADRWPGEVIVETGVGGLNVYKALSGYDRGEPVINFGYAGSNSIPVGTEVSVGRCRLLHPNVSYEEAEFLLDGNTDCWTFCDFVLEAEMEDPVVFDMELAFILAMGFSNVKSIKVVSDNLSIEEYEKTTK